MNTIEIYYNVWTIIEKVTVTDEDEIFEDIDDTYFRVGKTKTLDEAIDIQHASKRECRNLTKTNRNYGSI